MSNLTDLMIKATRGVETATGEQLDADLLRGSRARRRRRGFTIAGVGIGMTAAATATAIVIGMGAGAPVSTGNYAGSSYSAGGPVGASVALVDYVGAQPNGFILDRVPAEWRALTSDASSLVLGNTDDDGSSDTASGMASVEGRIAIGVTNAESLPQTLQERSLSVGDETATVYALLGADDQPDGTVLVTLAVSGSRFLSIQLPPTLNWNDEQMAQFVSGVHVTSDAQMTVG